MPSVYLSAQFEDAPVLREARVRLVALGCTVTSRWLDAATAVPATAQSGHAGAGERLSAIAAQDLEDIREADAVVVYNPPEACAIGRGGRHVETGFALALGKPIVVVGARGNVFHWLPAIALVSDWTELEGWLENRR